MNMHSGILFYSFSLFLPCLVFSDKFLPTCLVDNVYIHVVPSSYFVMKHMSF